MRATLLLIGTAAMRQILTDCDRRRPEEACGMLVGVPGKSGPAVRVVVPLANVWATVTERTTRYTVDPLEQMRAERQATADGLEVVGFYHSHPTGEPVPSGVDLNMAWPGYWYLIVGFRPAVMARAWVLDEASGQFLDGTIESAD